MLSVNGVYSATDSCWKDVYSFQRLAQREQSKIINDTQINILVEPTFNCNNYTSFDMQYISTLAVILGNGFWVHCHIHKKTP